VNLNGRLRDWELGRHSWPQHDIRARKKIEPAWQNRGSNNDREGDRQTREKFKNNISRKKIRFEETHDVMFDGAGKINHEVRTESNRRKGGSAGQLGRKSARSKAAQGCQSTGVAQSQSWRAACAANRAQSVGWRLRDWELGRRSRPHGMLRIGEISNFRDFDLVFYFAIPPAIELVKSFSGSGRDLQHNWYNDVERFTTQRRHVCITGESSPGWYTVRTLTCCFSSSTKFWGHTNNTPFGPRASWALRRSCGSATLTHCC